MENLLTYRLRLTLLNREVARALLTMAGDNRLCILAVPGLLVFAAASLAIERVALALLQREEWVGGLPPPARSSPRPPLLGPLSELQSWPPPPQAPKEHTTPRRLSPSTQPRPAPRPRPPRPPPASSSRPRRRGGSPPRRGARAARRATRLP